MYDIQAEEEPRYMGYAKASCYVGIFVNSSSNNSLHNPH